MTPLNNKPTHQEAPVMASELLPCPFCGSERAATIPANKKSTERLFPIVRCMGCFTDVPGKTNDFSLECTTAIERWNTRPTPVAHVSPDATGKCGELVTIKVLPGQTELVTRSQAVELLAAERAENTRLQSENDAQADQISELQMTPWPEWATKVLAVIRKRSGYDGYGDAIEGVDLPAELDECIAAIEADNAALTARVKELEQHCELLCDPTIIRLEKENSDLEAKLAAAEQALEPFAEHANGRAVDDTGWRDKETVKIVVSIGDLRKARAALGGK